MQYPNSKGVDTVNFFCKKTMQPSNKDVFNECRQIFHKQFYSKRVNREVVGKKR